MLDVFGFIVICSLVGSMGYIGGRDDGKKEGMEMLHAQKYSCQTLPDKTIHCWENKENK